MCLGKGEREIKEKVVEKKRHSHLKILIKTCEKVN